MFPYIGNVIIPIDETIFFREVGQPPTGGENHPIPWEMIGFSKTLWSRVPEGSGSYWEFLGVDVSEWDVVHNRVYLYVYIHKITEMYLRLE